MAGWRSEESHHDFRNDNEVPTPTAFSVAMAKTSKSSVRGATFTIFGSSSLVSGRVREDIAGPICRSRK